MYILEILKTVGEVHESTLFLKVSLLSFLGIYIGKENILFSRAGDQPRASHMQDMCSITESHSQPGKNIFPFILPSKSL